MGVNTNARREIGVILIVVMLIVGVLGIVRSRTSSQEPTGQVAVPTVTIAPSSITSMSTATPQPDITATPSVVLPDDARFRTPEQAGAYATEIVKLKFDAQDPRIVSVELLTLKDAMRQAQTTSGEDPGQAMAGFDSLPTSDATWRVVLDGTRFYIPRCPPGSLSENGTPATECGWFEAAIVYFSVYGDLRELQLPASLP